MPMHAVQVAFLGDLCWCHLDEERECAGNEKVPMKWETASFPKFAALLDHVNAGTPSPPRIYIPECANSMYKRPATSLMC
jgi:hypothetical protein